MKNFCFAIIMLILSTPMAHAYKECTVKTDRLYIGDGGYLWMLFANGGRAYIDSNDADFEATFTLLLAAQLANKTITVRFAADNAECNTDTRSDLVGVWLHRS